jgi:hypothetical protein
MKTLLVIMCYGGDLERIQRHLPFWRESGCDLLFVSPVDDPIRFEQVGHPCAQYALSEHHGVELIRRHIFAFNYSLLHSVEYDAFSFIEADSITLGAIPDHPCGGLRCFVWENTSKPRFQADHYFHWPLWADRSTLAHIASVARTDEPEEGFPDRWLALLCERHSIPFTHEPRAFSRNQLDNPDYMQSAVDAIKAGAIWVHGVKTKEQLEELCSRAGIQKPS